MTQVKDPNLRTFTVSDGSATETSSDDEMSIRNVKPDKAVTDLLIQGLTFNNAKLPDSFEPFVDKTKVGTLPLVNKPVVGYKSYKPLGLTPPPKGRTRRRIKKKLRKPAVPPARVTGGSVTDTTERLHPLPADNMSDSIVIGSLSDSSFSSSTSGSFIEAGHEKQSIHPKPRTTNM